MYKLSWDNNKPNNEQEPASLSNDEYALVHLVLSEQNHVWELRPISSVRVYVKNVLYFQKVWREGITVYCF